MAPNQVAKKHDFIAKVAGGCSSYDVIAGPRQFFLTKIAQGLPHQAIREKPQGVHQPPPPCTGEG